MPEQVQAFLGDCTQGVSIAFFIGYGTGYKVGF
jgi:hypothetical protein